MRWLMAEGLRFSECAAALKLPQRTATSKAWRARSWAGLSVAAGTPGFAGRKRRGAVFFRFGCMRFMSLADGAEKPCRF
jgi:hypothetical protein